MESHETDSATGNLFFYFKWHPLLPLYENVITSQEEKNLLFPFSAFQVIPFQYSFLFVQHSKLSPEKEVWDDHDIQHLC